MLPSGNSLISYSLRKILLFYISIKILSYWQMLLLASTFLPKTKFRHYMINGFLEQNTHSILVAYAVAVAEWSRRWIPDSTKVSGWFESV